MEQYQFFDLGFDFVSEGMGNAGMAPTAALGIFFFRILGVSDEDLGAIE